MDGIGVHGVGRLTPPGRPRQPVPVFCTGARFSERQKLWLPIRLYRPPARRQRASQEKVRTRPGMGVLRCRRGGAATQQATRGPRCSRPGWQPVSRPELPAVPAGVPAHPAPNLRARGGPGARAFGRVGRGAGRGAWLIRCVDDTDVWIVLDEPCFGGSVGPSGILCKSVSLHRSGRPSQCVQAGRLRQRCARQAPRGAPKVCGPTYRRRRVSDRAALRRVPRWCRPRRHALDGEQ